MISQIKCILLMSCLFLVACKPLLEHEFIAGMVGQGTELVEGDYAPKDHWSGQWRIINVWAEWCKPCWQEMPELNQFFALQGDNDVKLLGFNFDELEQGELLLLKEKMSIQFPVLTQWPSEWEKPEIKGLPASIILSPDDEIIDILWGPQNLTSLRDGVENAKKAIMDNDEG
ncbi:MAG: TlpA disulfide reductase family protein [Oleispira sp.]